MKNNQTLLRNIGLILVSFIVILFWYMGWFNFIFYILGLYTAIYIVSYLFKTTVVITFLLSIGGLLLYLVSAVVGLYLFYLVLSMMFNGSFWFGLIILILLSTILGGFLQLIPISIGLILGYPLIFMSEDLENRFGSNSINDSEQKDAIEIEVVEKIEDDQNTNNY